MKTHRFPLLVAAIFLAGTASGYDEVRARPALLLANKKLEVSLLRIDPSGRPWILNPRARALQRISDRGTVAVHIAGKKGPFRDPVDFTFLADGTLAVADAGDRKIVFIKGSGTDEGWKKAKVTGEFPVEKPSALAVSRDGIVAAGSTSEHAIDFHSLSGVRLHRLTPGGDTPFDEVTSLAFSGDGTLWALDGGRGILHRFSAERRWLGATDGLSGARAVAVDRYGFAYVTLEKGKWVEIDPTGANTGTFGAKGRQPGQLLEPVGIAADAGGVMVAEEGNRRLQGFDVINNLKKSPVLPAPAAFLQVHEAARRPGEVNSILFLPDGSSLVRRPNRSIDHLLADGSVKTTWKKKDKTAPGVDELNDWFVDTAGKIWVTDGGDHTVKEISLDGAVISTMGKKGKKEGSFSNPSHLAVRPDGSVVVADRGGSRVQVLNRDGLFLFAVGSRGKKDGQFDSVDGLAANGDTIALLDGDRKSLLFYNPAGRFLSSVANEEGKPANWDDPVAVATDPEGRFYVLDAGFGRVRAFSAKGDFLGDFAARGQDIAAGPDGRVAVLDEREQVIYEARFVPRAAEKVAATDQDGDIRVTWSPVAEAAGYRVYRSTGDGHFTRIGDTKETSRVDADVVPGTEYVYAVTGVGAGGHEGAWGAAAPVKASRRKDVSLISIENVTLRPAFTAAFKYYVTQPVGEVSIRNNDEKAYRNVKVAVSLARYTDFATVSVIPSVEAGETLEVPVNLTLNNKVLELTENTPVQADVRVSYFEDNIEKHVSQSAPVTLYARNAISWSDKARLSSFVTPRDTPIAEFSRAGIRAFMAELKGSTVGKPLAKAMLFYEAVNALDISYVPDPNTPFNVVSGKPDVIDYVQFPRETLRRKTGDCDDTTALMSALLESVGVQTAIVDMPGHVLLMANTEEPDAEIIGLPEERFVLLNGTYWVPIETTRLGKGFMTAWQAGISAIRDARAKGGVEFVQISEASKTYPPVTLVGNDPDTPAFPGEALKTSFPAQLVKLQKERYDSQMASLKKRMKADPDNRWLKIELAMIEVEGGNQAAAASVLEALTAEAEPADIRAAAENNLGNLAYLTGDFKAAAARYDAAGMLAPEDGGILVNRARAAWKMGESDRAKTLVADGAKSMSDWREYAGDLPPELIPK